ncbi:MAG: hypothetical protein B7Z75_13615 [Acidocella sp. 20-57-95]|nr:MAG: hypothetical protein B7Z75_13615 [Acidocella sp. 20-57-95]OYV62262.1 MAG: hypothetical protein B7Z71_01860 [Acidocella sp. 21-58-7]HQT63083.1 DUF3576 domain-containing protein [Acidocella sp.]HQU03604.1 DUF3576 domain-containing protein [Acidocella sp.]
MNLRRNVRFGIFSLALAPALAACSYLPHGQPLAAGQLNNTMAQEVPGANVNGTNAFPGLGLNLGNIGKGQSGTGIQVNAFLWRGTLDTLSFMPLVSADPFGGVVITDWYSPPATPNERFKANAYILSQTMSANAVKVTVFHQVQQNGQWVDAPVDPSTASGLEDRILARAADLKAESQNSK